MPKGNPAGYLPKKYSKDGTRNPAGKKKKGKKGKNPFASLIGKKK